MFRTTMLAIVAVLVLQPQDSLADPVDKLRQAIQAFQALEARVEALEQAGDSDTLADIAGCIAGDTIEFDGSMWECVPPRCPCYSSGDIVDRLLVVEDPLTCGTLANGTTFIHPSTISTLPNHDTGPDGAGTLTCRFTFSSEPDGFLQIKPLTAGQQSACADAILDAGEALGLVCTGP